MPALKTVFHEKFAQEYFARGCLKNAATDIYLDLKHGTVSKTTAQSWASRILNRPDVRARIQELSDQAADEIVRRSVRRRDVRLKVYEDLYERIQMVMDDRSVEHGKIAGGRSGLVSKDERFDSAMMQSSLNLLKQVAIETGDWVEKQEGATTTIQNVNYIVELVDPEPDPDDKGDVIDIPMLELSDGKA